MSTIVNNDNSDRRNVDTNTSRNSRLKFLDDLSGYKVHHDDVDPSGYTVKLQSGESIGEVEGLLADTTAKVVRYVEVELDEEVIGRHDRGLYEADERHALIPVGLIHIDRENRNVILSGVAYDHLVDYPRFRKQHGYTTRYEVDTNDYLAGFHEYGNTYNRDRFSTDTHREADMLDEEFYTSDFYTTRATRPTSL
ncbi:hypothetical protein [Lewinella sp. IMCC34183]|uniref:hypothetical protein n=1 Tax=Lewinella sp. IMCC34183 TaxID=2248762 RepID=UPI000E21DD0A|nr:hypothetical protein [Lewinella sp. IMCC34183]